MIIFHLSANRSVVLLRLNEYEKCLSDISAALHFGYPDNLQYKLYERRGACHQALGYVAAILQITYLNQKHMLTGIIMKPRKDMKKPWNFLRSEKLLRAKKKEIETDLMKSISEVSVECENMPIALLSKDKYKVKSPHKQVHT